MVTRSLILSIVILASVGTARADLQLTPRLSTYELDGVKFKQLAFSDGGAKDITYSPPAGWSYSGSSGELTLRPPNKPQAEATVTKVALQTPVTFDADTMKQLADQALASAPKGSTNVALVDQQKNPVVIERKETFLVVVSYTFYGQNYERSIMYLNRGKEQLQFQLVSRAEDFKDLQRAFFASQFSWQNL